MLNFDFNFVASKVGSQNLNSKRNFTLKIFFFTKFFPNYFSPKLSLQSCHRRVDAKFSPRMICRYQPHSLPESQPTNLSHPSNITAPMSAWAICRICHLNDMQTSTPTQSIYSSWNPLNITASMSPKAICRDFPPLAILTQPINFEVICRFCPSCPISLTTIPKSDLQVITPTPQVQYHHLCCNVTDSNSLHVTGSRNNSWSEI